jgi:hypothetical protein
VAEPAAAAAPEPVVALAVPPQPPRAVPPPSEDALDLGATVLPILARTYGPQTLMALVALVVGYLWGRRSR